MAKIKICGLRRDEDIAYVNELKPDYIGFILTSGFRRSIDFDTAKHLKSLLSPNITAVGVFVHGALQAGGQSQQGFPRTGGADQRNNV